MEENSLIKHSISDFAKLKVQDLKKELKLRGLSTSGNKTELLERLQMAAQSKLDDNGSAESVDDLDDDLLNDDDSDHYQDDLPNECVLNELDEQLDVSPPINVTKRPLEKDTLDPKPLKKLVLNRKPSVVSDSNNDKDKEALVVSIPPNAAAVKTVSNDNNTVAKDSDDKRVIKLTNLSAKERLEMRAIKFGTPTSVEAKKVARLERFGGTTPDTSISQSSAAISKATSSLDTLKKRAERFGGSVSKVMSGLEQQERLELRKARFGNLPTTCVVENDKAKQRLERFKTPVI